MKTLFKIVLIFLISSVAVASEKESFDFFKNYNSDYQKMKREQVAPKSNTRGPASVVSVVDKVGLEKDFYINSWKKYADLSDNTRRSVIKKFSDKDMVYNLDQMVTFIKMNKRSLTSSERIKAAELRGQYDALLTWN